MTPTAFVTRARQGPLTDELLRHVRLNVPWYLRLRWLGVGPDRNAAFRLEVAIVLFNDRRPEDRALIQYLLEQEIAHAGYVYNQCVHVTILSCCLLLYRLGHVEDSLLIGRAKLCCFDMQAMVDVQCLCGGGLEATIEYLGGIGSKEAQALHEYIQDCRDEGAFDELPAWANRFEASFRADYELGA